MIKANSCMTSQNEKKMKNIHKIQSMAPPQSHCSSVTRPQCVYQSKSNKGEESITEF